MNIDELKEKTKKTLILDKPRLDTKTKAVVIRSILDVYENKDKDAPEEYLHLNWKITFEIMLDKEPYTFEEVYRGIRLYKEQGDMYTPRVSSKTSAGNIIKLLQDIGVKYKDVYDLPNLITGRVVKIKSKAWNFGGREGFNNYIEDIE